MEKVPTVWFPVYEAQGNAGGLFGGGGFRETQSFRVDR